MTATAVRRGAALTLAGVALGLAVWFWTLDIYSSVSNPGSPDPPFCGSAYDIVLLKGDGYMGGEYAPNQDAIDQDCMRQGRAALGWATAATGVGAGAAWLGLRGLRVSNRRARTVDLNYCTLDEE